MSKLFVSQTNVKAHTQSQRNSLEKKFPPVFFNNHTSTSFTPPYFHISIFHLCIQITYLNMSAVMVKKPYAPRT